VCLTSLLVGGQHTWGRDKGKGLTHPRTLLQKKITRDVKNDVTGSEEKKFQTCLKAEDLTVPWRRGVWRSEKKTLWVEGDKSFESMIYNRVLKLRWRSMTSIRGENVMRPSENARGTHLEKILEVRDGRKPSDSVGSALLVERPGWWRETAKETAPERSALKCRTKSH